jgi:metal-dependent amidase/aminoacylase/carboxypeptidase family protein
MSLKFDHSLTHLDFSSRNSTQDEYLDFVSHYIDSISEVLRPISLKIHDNPELNYQEFIAHETLVTFMKSRRGWKVTPSAYGIQTAFIAVYDSGREGPVISYNAEYGKNCGMC